MKVEEIKKQLKKDIAHNDFKPLFEKLKKYISPESELIQLIEILDKRVYSLKVERLKGSLEDEQKFIERSKITNDLLELVFLIQEEDLQEEDISKSIDALINKIKKVQEELKKIAYKNSEGVISIGHSLIKLGQLLQEKPSADSSLTREEIILNGTQKAHRRLKIGFIEMRQLKLSSLDAFNQLLSAYSQLVQYLDYPKEQLTSAHLRSIKEISFSLEGYIERLEKNPQNEALEMQKAQNLLSQILPFKEQLGNPFSTFFSTTETIINEVDGLLDFLEGNKRQFDELKRKLYTQLTELKINIREMEL